VIVIEDLYEEAVEIRRQMVMIEEMRKQHRKAVLKCLEEPGGNVQTLVDILRITERITE